MSGRDALAIIIIGLGALALVFGLAAIDRIGSTTLTVALTILVFIAATGIAVLVGTLLWIALSAWWRRRRR